ncbi:Glutathione S-transferase T3 [Cardamine amara subsp. amara]|uniref:Glutathione S-transferase T3 n=1 Tax=Cardamine amara subsp. amara TaxID=228776 RepID=A0ABD0ZLC4_CARAN
MDTSIPFSNTAGFMNLLNSTQFTSLSPSIDLQSSKAQEFNSQWNDGPSQAEHTAEDKRGRHNWTPKEDILLISAWLNTSKDPVVGNEQKGKCIAAYFDASPTFAGKQKRLFSHCKQRWCKINDQVCKYIGCLKAATSQKSSGQNENDVMKLANEIYLNDHGVRFTLDHCWRELRHDQKWCDASSTTDNGKSKRRKCDNGDEASGQSSSSYTVDNGDEEMARPPGVKASKAKAKRSIKGVEEDIKALKEYQSIWEIKQQDYKLREKHSKLKVLESLLAKTEPLSEIDMALNNKLATDMLSSL